MAEKFKIAVLVDSFARGGVAQALQVMLQFLPKDRYDITLFIKKTGGDMLPIPEGIRWLPIPDERRFSPADWARELLSWRNYGKKLVYAARRRSMLPGEYDCAIGYQMVSNDIAVMTLEKVRAKRKLLWLHGEKKYREQDLPFYDTLYAGADGIVCVSGDTEKRFRRLMKVSGQKAVTIHNFYDIPAIRSRAAEAPEGMEIHPGAVTIASVGRISKEKGFDRVPAVMELLLGAGYDVHWYIVGDGNTRPQLEAELEKRGLSDRVHLLGHRKNPYPYIRACGLYVQPSYTEGFCTSTMEAKILGKAVVTTDVPGMAEQFVSGENGLIVESSVQGLFDGIRRLLDDQVLRERIEKNLSREPITNDEVLRQTMAVIEGRPLEK